MVEIREIPQNNSEENISLLEEVHARYKELTLLLIDRKKSITTMESCTSGLIASLISDTEGSSQIMRGAFVTYSNEAKILQGVPSEVIDKYGVYSINTAESMALACKKAYSADIGIGVTGTLGNVDPNNQDSIPGNVFFAIAKDDSVTAYACELSGYNNRFCAKLCIADEICIKLLDIIRN